LKIEELSAIALGRSSGPTICTMKAWRAGTSKALTSPTPAAKTMRSWTEICRAAISVATASARSIRIVCVAISRR